MSTPPLWRTILAYSRNHHFYIVRHIGITLAMGYIGISMINENATQSDTIDELQRQNSAMAARIHALENGDELRDAKEDVRRLLRYVDWREEGGAWRGG